MSALAILKLPRNNKSNHAHKTLLVLGGTAFMVEDATRVHLPAHVKNYIHKLAAMEKVPHEAVFVVACCDFSPEKLKKKGKPFQVSHRSKVVGLAKKHNLPHLWKKWDEVRKQIPKTV